MKEKFEQFVLQSKQALLESEYYEQANRISFVCQIIPFHSRFFKDRFALLMYGGIETKSDVEGKVSTITLFEDFVEPITIEQFKQFIADYFQDNSDLHTELIVPDTYYGLLFDSSEYIQTLQDFFEILDESQKEGNWDWAMSGGVGFRLVQDVVD